MRSPADLPVPARLAGFALVLALSFGAAFGVGRAVGPVERDDPAVDRSTTDPGHGGDSDHGDGHGAGGDEGP